MTTQNQLIELYVQACEIDVRAFKPGNVSIYNAGHDMTVADFILSSEVSAYPITATQYSLGERIFYAVKATQEAVSCNTNLGIILLCAPLIQAAYQQQPRQDLRASLQQVLKQTTQEDTHWIFQAISLAAPGGLGQSEQQDVRSTPTVTLLQAMEMACERDRIALQYVTSYKDIFDFSVLRYNEAYVSFEDQAWAAVAVFTGLLTQFPDSHIERKFGTLHSDWVLKQMLTVDNAVLNTTDPEQLLPLLHQVDKQFKAKGINPGTTADLTVATVLVVLMEALSVR